MFLLEMQVEMSYIYIYLKEEGKKMTYVLELLIILMKLGF